MKRRTLLQLLIVSVLSPLGCKLYKAKKLLGCKSYKLKKYCNYSKTDNDPIFILEPISPDLDLRQWGPNRYLYLPLTGIKGKHCHDPYMDASIRMSEEIERKILGLDEVDTRSWSPTFGNLIP